MFYDKYTWPEEQKELVPADEKCEVLTTLLLLETNEFRDCRPCRVLL